MKILLKTIWLLLSVSLITIIFLRTPQKSGLVNLETKNNVFGSPSSTDRTLNILTLVMILGYFFVAIKLNY